MVVPRITEMKEFSVEELFLGMEAGYRQTADIAQKEGLIATLGKIVQSGCEAVAYDNPGVFGVEMSEGVDMALVDKHRLEKETSAMKEHLDNQQRRLLQMVFRATITVDADYGGAYGERVWGVGYAPLRSKSTRIKELLEGEVNGIVTGLHLRSSTIRLENRRYSADRLKKYIEVPLLDRFGQRCAIITPRTPGRFERISEQAVKNAAMQSSGDKKAIRT